MLVKRIFFFHLKNFAKAINSMKYVACLPFAGDLKDIFRYLKIQVQPTVNYKYFTKSLQRIPL